MNVNTNEITKEENPENLNFTDNRDNWKFFDDCDMAFENSISITKKNTLVIMLNHAVELGSLTDWGAKIWTQREPYKTLKILFVSNIGVNVSINLFSKKEHNNLAYYLKFFLFFMKCISPSVKLISKNTVFKSDRYFIGYVMGLDKLSAFKNNLYKLYVPAEVLAKQAQSKQESETEEAKSVALEQIPSMIETKEVKASSDIKFLSPTSSPFDTSFINKKKEARIVLSDGPLTCMFRKFSQKNQIEISNMGQLMQVLSLNNPFSDRIKDLELHCELLDIILKKNQFKSSLILFSSVPPIRSTDPLARNVNWIYFYSVSNKDIIFLEIRRVGSQQKWVLLRETTDINDLYIKLYKSDSTSCYEESFLTPSANIVKFLKEENLLKEDESSNIDKKRKTDFEKEQDYEDYLEIVRNVDSQTCIYTNVYSLSNKDSLINTLSYKWNIQISEAEILNDPLEMIKNFSSAIIFKNLTVNNIFIIPADDFHFESKIVKVKEVIFCKHADNLPVRMYVITRDRLYECFMTKERPTCKFVIDKDLLFKKSLNMKSSPIKSVLDKLYEYTKSWDIVDIIRSSIFETKNQNSYKDALRYIVSNVLLDLKVDELKGFEEHCDALRDMNVDNLNKFLLSDTSSVLTAKSFIRENLEDFDEQNLYDYLSGSKFYIEDNRVNNKEIVLNSLINKNFEDKKRPFNFPFIETDDIIKDIINFQIKSCYYYKFVILYVYKRQISNKRIDWEIINVYMCKPWEKDDNLFIYDIETGSLHIIKNSFTGYLKFNTNFIKDLKTIDYSPVKESFLTRSSKFECFGNLFERNLINFFYNNINQFGKTIKNEILKNLLYIYDLNEIELKNGKGIFTEYYSEATKVETLKLKVEELSEKGEKEMEISKFLEENFHLIDTKEKLKKIWFNFVPNPQEKLVYEKLSLMLSENLVKGHPHTNLELFFSSVVELKDYRLKAIIESNEMLKQELVKEIDKELEISKEEIKYREVFKDDIVSIISFIENKPDLDLEDFETFLDATGISKRLFSYQAMLSRKSENPKDDVLVFDASFDMTVLNKENCLNEVFKSFINRPHIKENHKEEIKRSDIENGLIKIIRKDADFEIFSLLNEFIRNNIHRIEDYDVFISFLEKYSLFCDKLFKLMNSLINSPSFRNNSQIKLSNFMSWTHLRHDVLSLAFIKHMLPTYSHKDFDISFSDFFTNLQRTPDMILFSKNKKSLLIVEFTYSHKEEKGKLAKGCSIETSKYYPEIYSIYNCNEFENIYYWPIVFSKFCSNPEYSFYTDLQRNCKFLFSVGFPVYTENFEKFRDSCSKISSIFLNNTDLIYAPDKLFNRLISNRTYEAGINDVKYTCVEYNAEFVDTVFKDDEPSRMIFHLVFGKYLDRNISKSRINEIISDYQKNNLSVDKYMSELDEFNLDRITTSWLIIIFNKAINSFTLKDKSAIGYGNMNFYKELIRRTDKILREISPANSPYYADGNYILNEFYNRMMDENSTKSSLCVMNASFFSTARIPKKDVYSYYKSSAIMKKNFDVKKTQKLLFFDVTEQEFKRQIEFLKNMINDIKSRLSNEKERKIMNLMNEIILIDDIEEYKIKDFFKNYSRKIKYKLEYPALTEDEFINFLKNNINMMIIKCFLRFKNIQIFRDLDTEALNILSREGVINKELGLFNIRKEIRNETEEEFEESQRQSYSKWIINSSVGKLSIEKELLEDFESESNQEENIGECSESDFEEEDPSVIERKEKVRIEVARIAQGINEDKSKKEKLRLMIWAAINRLMRSSKRITNYSETLNKIKEIENDDLAELIKAINLKNDEENASLTESLKGSNDDIVQSILNNIKVINKEDYDEEWIAQKQHEIEIERKEAKRREFLSRAITYNNDTVWISDYATIDDLRECTVLISESLLKSVMLEYSFFSEINWVIRVTTFKKFLAHFLKVFDKFKNRMNILSDSKRLEFQTVCHNFSNLMYYINKEKLVNDKDIPKIKEAGNFKRIVFQEKPTYYGKVNINTHEYRTSSDVVPLEIFSFLFMFETYRILDIITIKIDENMPMFQKELDLSGYESRLSCNIFTSQIYYVPNIFLGTQIYFSDFLDKIEAINFKNCEALAIGSYTVKELKNMFKTSFKTDTLNKINDIHKIEHAYNRKNTDNADDQVKRLLLNKNDLVDDNMVTLNHLETFNFDD